MCYSFASISPDLPNFEYFVVENEVSWAITELCAEQIEISNRFATDL